MYQSIKTASKSPAKPDAKVLFYFKDRKLDATGAAIDKSAKGAIAAALKRAECPGELGEITPVFGPGGERIIMVGLGESEKLTTRAIRRAGGVLINALSRAGAGKADFAVGEKVIARVPAAAIGRALGEGMGLAACTFDQFKKSMKSGGGVKSLAVSTNSAEATKALQRGLDLADATNFSRRLSATPPNIATTDYIAGVAQKLAKGSDGALKCTVIRGAALQAQKLNGLINVGKASENAPCLIQLTYTPGGKSKGTILLVGKTICYDTGGLSLKINNTMKGMKYDKDGGMAVLGVMSAITKLKPKVKVVALLPAAENSISDEAYRPDDIIEYLNGVTVEVTNTDAEGRLVLADALAYGCAKFQPDAIIDIATLTGGVVVALGKVCAGLFCDDDPLRARIEAAAESSGERVWRLPLFDEYRDMMKSKHADIWNSAPVREAHPIQGGAFLSYFVEPGIPWAHLDIAGTHAIDKDEPPFTSGPTGFGVRLLIDVLMNW